MAMDWREWQYTVLQPCRLLTQRRLQQAPGVLTVADGMQVSGVHKPPEVVLIIAAVQAQSQPRTLEVDDGRNARRRQVTRVRRFQLHPSLELVRRWNSSLKHRSTCGASEK